MARTVNGAGSGAAFDNGADDGLGIKIDSPATDASVGTEGFTDPALGIQDGAGDTGRPKRGRGRPRGSTSRTAEASPKRALGAEGVAALLVSVHSALVIVSKCPELSIAEDEANALARASVNVAKLYDVQTSEKALAWTNLIGVAGSIYITRMMAINMRWRMEAAERKNANAGNNVFPYPGNPATPGMRPN